jgi:hypothetical protein
MRMHPTVIIGIVLSEMVGTARPRIRMLQKSFEHIGAIPDPDPDSHSLSVIVNSLIRR